MKTLKVGDAVQLNGIEHSVETIRRVSIDRYFLRNIVSGNGTIFNLLGLHPVNFVKAVVGYEGYGIFPECHTLEDLTKVVEALQKEIEKLESKVYSIQDLAEGNVAIDYNRKPESLEGLSKVLKKAFPLDTMKVEGVYQFYFTSFINNDNWIPSNRTALPTQPLEVFLKELEASEFVLPARWAVKVTDKNMKMLEAWRGMVLGDTKGYCFSERNGTVGYWVSILTSEDYVLITDEQFIKYVAEAAMRVEEPEQEVTYKVSTQDMKRLWVAVRDCSKWSGIIYEQYGRNIINEETCIVPRSLLDKAYNEANCAQKTLLDKIFPQNVCPYKDGELVLVRDYATDMWLLRYSTGKLVNRDVETYSNQHKSGNTASWKLHAPATGLTLPK